ncbi:MAG: ATP-binding protein [Microcella sp.]|uniref:sensor histidine kinase n=1 Tax=Microcella sp. TaxID=1913979 RepID=UPI0033147E00
MRGWSLQQRLVAGILALLAVATLGIGVVSTFALRSSLVGQLDDELRSTTQRVAATLEAGSDEPGRSLLGPGLPLGSLIAIVSPQGRVTAAYLDLDAEVRELSALQQRVLAGASVEQPRTIRFPGRLGEYRVLGVPVGQNSTVVVGLSTREVTVTTARLGATITAVLVGTLLIAAALGRSVARVALRPLTRIRETATRVTELPLDRGAVALSDRLEAIDTDPRTEVGQLGAAFTRMLDHVQSALLAREASEGKVRQFVADASHELRTPLAAIRGYSELTRRGGHEVPPDVRHALDRIESESVRMTGLVDDLLLLARLDEGRALRADPVDLGRVIADALADARATSGDHNWSVDVPDEPVVVIGDQGRLHQVVANLLANARVHTPDGTSVAASVAAVDGEAIVRVADDGPGIPAEVQPVLFERFARADTSRSRATGSTGLGLAIVAAVVGAHNGRVSVESRPGRTVFTVRLPLLRAE